MDTFNEQMIQLKTLMVALDAAQNGDTKLVLDDPLGLTAEGQATLKEALIAALKVQIKTLQQDFNKTIGSMVG